jgi:hypothetical protein
MKQKLAVLTWLILVSFYLYLLSIATEGLEKPSFNGYVHGLGLLFSVHMYFKVAEILMDFNSNAEAHFSALIKQMLLGTLGFALILLGFFIVAFGGVQVNVLASIVGYALIMYGIFLVYDQVFKAEKIIISLKNYPTS